MASILDRLPGFALPFVTRSLRGGRGRRYAAMSLGLALLTAMLCAWIGLGRSDLAYDMRVDLGVEMRVESREHHEFVIVDRGHGETPESLRRRQAAARERGLDAVLAASLGGEHPTQAELLREARAFVESHQLQGRSDFGGFSWHAPSEVHRLGKILERGGEPPIVEYTPGVGLDATLRMLAMATGGLLILLLTMLAPLLVALQQASERHENTLQPLTGTALRARELSIGLACGPLAIVAIFAAPIAGLYIMAALATGEPVSLLLLPILAGTAIGLVFGAQLLAHLVGARRAPGLIGVALLMFLGMLRMASMGIASGHEAGVAAVLPQSGMFGLLVESFGDPWRAASFSHFYPGFYPSLQAAFMYLVAPALIGTLGATLLGLLALRALARHLEGRSTLLDAGEALLGALICIAMVDFAIPAIDRAEPFRQAIGLPMLALPFFLLIMARVPTGDIPTKLRRIPMARLLGEYAAWVALQIGIAATIDQTLAGLHPITLLGIAWCVGVMVLLAVRLVATPPRILGTLWMLVCVGMLPFTFGIATIWAFEPQAPAALSSGASIMVTTWAALVLLVPALLLSHLRGHVASIAGKTR